MRTLQVFVLSVLLAGCGAAPGAGSSGLGESGESGEGAGELQCGPGTEAVDGQCIPKSLEGGLRCGEGTAAVDGACLPSGEAGEAKCGPGTVEENGRCVPAEPGAELICGPGTEEREGACVALETGDGLECGEGTEARDGVCVALETEAPIVCGEGTAERNGECVSTEEGPECGPGTVEVQGRCIVEGSGCVGDVDCPRGLFCIDGGCRERNCEPGARRCTEDEVEVCDGDGQAWSFRRACERGCGEGACVPQVCPPLAVRCDASGDLEQCDARGLNWQAHADCEHGCVAGSCREGDAGGQCEAGERRCEGDSVLVCSGDQSRWEFSSACATACVGGACAPAGCEAGARRCDGAMLEQCDRRGLGWDVVTACDHGCSEGACQRAPLGGGAACPDATRRCVGDSVEMCTNQAWTLLEVCQTGCQGGDCREPICQPGDRRCDDADMEVEICSADGTEWRFRRACPTSCDRGQCLPQLCEPFIRRCNALLPQQCNPTGTAWIDGAPCNFSCLEGACDQVPAGGCQPGHERCDGLTRQRCSQAFSWEVVEECQAACIQGECVSCSPNSLRCDEGVLQRCVEGGIGWGLEEDCEVGCLRERCTVCEPGARRCNGDVIEVCDADGQGWSAASLCLTACEGGGCTACRPDALRCNGRTVEACDGEGSGWALAEECGGRCEAGVCGGEAVCEPGQRRCDGSDVQVCTPDASAWLTLQSCMGVCAGGACTGSACLPFGLSVTPGSLPADGLSSALVVSDLILDMHGTPVPDGTLFTLRLEGAEGLAADGDPNTEGVQVRSLNGRLDFGIRSPGEPGLIEVSAVHPVASRCQGSLQIQAVEGVEASVALDFTADTFNDVENTTALWDTILGRVDPFPSDFGGGEDGELVVQNTYNLNQHSQPGRLFPDAVNFNVEALGLNAATVEGGVGGIDIGDEVLLINLQGAPDAHEHVGNYELLEVARIDYGLNTLYFTTALRRLYGVGDSNEDLTGQKIMLQRVPHYTNVTLRSDLTANGWNGERGGVVFFKALGQVAVDSGNITADSLGYRGSSARVGEGFAGWPAERRTEENYGGGGSHTDGRYACGGGGGHASAARDTRPNDRGGRGGREYGDAALTRWFLGSAGGSCENNHSDRSGQYGGGIVVVWAGGIAVRGGVQARGGSSGGCWNSGPGAGGTIFLRGRSLNVGNNRVRADGHDYGGDSPQSSDGRIRLDFFGLAGTTRPEHHPGFAGDTNVRTLSLDHAVVPITTVTLVQVVADQRGGRLSYEVTNNGEQWFEVTEGSTVEFGGAVGNDLQLRVSFSNDNLQPLTLNGVVLSYTTAD